MSSEFCRNRESSDSQGSSFERSEHERGLSVAGNLRLVCSLVSSLFLGLSWFATPVLHAQPQSPPSKKRPSTVEDAIRMTRLAGSDYFSGADSKGRVAQFSPDGRLFVIVLRKGNVEQNTNEFSLLLYRTADAFRSPKPEILLKMSSSSNRDAITQVRWLSDSQTILFVGENPGEISQVLQLDVRTRRLITRTSSLVPISAYDCTPDGRTVLFEADIPHDHSPSPGEEQVQRNGIVIAGQTLQDLLAGRYGQPNWGQQLFLQEEGRPPLNLPIPEGNYVFGADSLSLAPNGRHALVRTNLMVKALSSNWAEYDYGHDSAYLHIFFDLPLGTTPTPFATFLLVDAASLSVKPLWNAPVLGSVPVAWSQDGDSLYLAGARLPLEGASAEERRLRQHESYDVAVSIVTRQYRKISKEEFPNAEIPGVQLEVTMEEDANTPPSVFVFDPRTKQKALLFDLNPQFGELDLGRVETTEWTVDGVSLIGGLYLPPDYVPGRKYPLVIQTHGFAPTRFSMDGLHEWSSGFAARALAASGFLVLQEQKFKNQSDHDHYLDAGKFGATRGQRGRSINVHGIEAAIDYLDRKGLIDKSRVGISGFSRSVSFVGYLLTHSTKHFSAASLVDGVDGGYFQELAYSQFAYDKDEMNGGATPFGEGLKTWLKESPSFSLGNVRTPLRLLALGKSTGVSELWEWFAALSLQKKPVDYVLLPDAAHLVVKPWERIVAQQGLVDWFRFWLKGEEDPDPAKAEQYVRWRELRKLQEENDAKDKAAKEKAAAPN
jgi:dipeptidyl aminopeptidase/acylaminoacyl peptidase